MSTSNTPTRLHHTAYLSKDLEATRAFYEDLVGLPLVATWSETDELFGAERVYCHTFFGMPDGSALAFFQFANKSDQDLFDPELTPSTHLHRHKMKSLLACKRPAGSQRAPTSSSMATAVRCTPKTRTACCLNSQPMLQEQKKSTPSVAPMLTTH